MRKPTVKKATKRTKLIAFDVDPLVRSTIVVLLTKSEIFRRLSAEKRGNAIQSIGGRVQKILTAYVERIEGPRDEKRKRAA